MNNDMSAMPMPITCRGVSFATVKRPSPRVSRQAPTSHSEVINFHADAQGDIETSPKSHSERLLTIAKPCASSN
jgi:hypothetical protein